MKKTTTEKPFVELVDLRSICRRGGTTTVALEIPGGRRETWIRAGLGGVDYFERRNEWRLKARIDATDFEHDSAYAFALPLLALRLDFVDNGAMHFTARIAPPVGPFDDDFRVPRPGYDPANLADAEDCEHCAAHGHPHRIVPEGHYMPPCDIELWRKVQGFVAHIVIAPDYEADVEGRKWPALDIAERQTLVQAVERAHREVTTAFDALDDPTFEARGEPLNAVFTNLGLAIQWLDLAVEGFRAATEGEG